MFDFRQKNKFRKFFYSPVVVVIFVIIASYTLYSTWSLYLKLAQSRQDLEKSQKQLLALASKNNQLDSQINELQTDQGVEKEIRSKFGIAKPGENMAVIVSDGETSTTSDSNNESFFQKFLHFLGL